MSNFSLLECLKLKLNILTLFRVKVGGSGEPIFFLQISFSWVEIRLQVEFHPPGLPRSGRFMVGDNKKKTKKKKKIP